MRSLYPHIAKDLESKFVLLTGPRQVGKTHLAEQILKVKKGSYYNWDVTEDRQTILERGFSREGLVVFDEIHKYERWKGFLKGLYDKHHETLQALVTGSARMDIYRRGGDSLFGRHYLHHLHPLTVGEILDSKKISPPSEMGKTLARSQEVSGIFKALLKFGGFPEPFYKASEQEHGRWSLQRRELLLRQDIKDLTQIQMISVIEHLTLLLPSKIGAVLSLHSLKEELQVAYNTVKAWIGALEKLYWLYALKPYSKKISRGLLKASKVYLWDWSQIPDEGSRFENLMASHLLKATQLWRDLGYGDYQLHFLRDRSQREVDFFLTCNQKPFALIEAKLADSQISDSLRYFSNLYSVPVFQILAKEGVNCKKGPVQVLSASEFLSSLP